MLSAGWKYLDAPNRAGLVDALAPRLGNPAGPATGVLALVAEDDAGVVGALQAVAGELGLQLAGAIVPGLIADGEIRRSGILLGSLGAGTPHRIVPLPHADGRATAAAIGALARFATVSAAPEGGDTLLLLVDATIPDVASVVDRLYMEVGDQVNYAGACVGSETFQPIPCLFDNHAFVGEAALAIVARDHPGATLAHHYRGGDALWVATASAGSRIAKIDGRPAFEVYRQLMSDEYDIELGQDDFYRYAVHFPFALNRAQGESLVRIPVKVDADGAVCCSGEVPENGLLSVVRAVAPGSRETAEAVGSGARGSRADVVLAFYCAGRLMHLGAAAATDELAALAKVVAPQRIVGSLCLGEIGSGRRLYPAFHNATIAALPWC